MFGRFVLLLRMFFFKCFCLPVLETPVIRSFQKLQELGRSNRSPSAWKMHDEGKKTRNSLNTKEVEL